LKVRKSGIAVGIDHIDELVQGSVKNVEKDPVASPLLNSQQLRFFVGDGRKGYESLAPYDAIHVGAAAAEIPQAVSNSTLHYCQYCWRLFNATSPQIIISYFATVSFQSSNLTQLVTCLTSRQHLTSLGVQVYLSCVPSVNVMSKALQFLT